MLCGCLTGPRLTFLCREGEWDFYWCDVRWLQENFDHTYMDEHVRISHFRNHYELTRKNYIVKNLKRFRKQLERESGKMEAMKCDFFPKTFEMPSEYHLFVEEFRKNPGITWIMKPAKANWEEEASSQPCQVNVCLYKHTAAGVFAALVSLPTVLADEGRRVFQLLYDNLSVA
ncbi:hypothetical protein lerEdw1_004678 [Lerista edwardsae]|nr:hypothetical protein lerEdw1_004678 [Lerista edwardsae]